MGGNNDDFMHETFAVPVGLKPHFDGTDETQLDWPDGPQYKLVEQITEIDPTDPGLGEEDMEALAGDGGPRELRF